MKGRNKGSRENIRGTNVKEEIQKVKVENKRCKKVLRKKINA